MVEYVVQGQTKAGNVSTVSKTVNFFSSLLLTTMCHAHAAAKSTETMVLKESLRSLFLRTKGGHIIYNMLIH